MSILTALTGGKSAQDLILQKFAQQAAKQGIKTLLISITEEGEYRTDILTDKQIIVNTDTHEFLMKFYNEHKNTI